MLRASSIPWQKPKTPKADSAKSDLANHPFVREIHNDGGSGNAVETTAGQSYLNHAIETGELLLGECHSSAVLERVQLLTLPIGGGVRRFDAQMPELIEHRPDRRVLAELSQCLGTPPTFCRLQRLLQSILSVLSDNRTEEPSLQQNNLGR